MKTRIILLACALALSIVVLLMCAYCRPQGARAQDECWPTDTPTPTHQHRPTRTPMPTPTSTTTPTLTATQSTAVQLVAFEADGKVVTWKTGIEINTVGFNVWRAFGATESYTRVNAALIPAKTPGSIMGDTYRFEDGVACETQTCYYKLEEVATDGGSWHGPVDNGIAANNSSVDVLSVGITIPPLGLAIAIAVLGIILTLFFILWPSLHKK